MRRPFCNDPEGFLDEQFGLRPRYKHPFIDEELFREELSRACDVREGPAFLSLGYILIYALQRLPGKLSSRVHVNALAGGGQYEGHDGDEVGPAYILFPAEQLADAQDGYLAFNNSV